MTSLENEILKRLMCIPISDWLYLQVFKNVWEFRYSVADITIKVVREKSLETKKTSYYVTGETQNKATIPVLRDRAKELWDNLMYEKEPEDKLYDEVISRLKKA